MAFQSVTLIPITSVISHPIGVTSKKQASILCFVCFTSERVIELAYTNRAVKFNFIQSQSGSISDLFWIKVLPAI